MPGLGQYLFNSLVVAGLTVAITLRVSLLGGYAFARFDFPGRNLLFLLTLAILMVPYATVLIPLFVLLNDLGLQNSLLGVSLVLVDVPAAVRHLHDAHLVRVGAPRAGGVRAGGRLRHVRGAAADPAAVGAPGPHHGRVCSPSWRRGTTSSRRSSC